eukprot:GHRR01032083.1.p2 GENE.GHRR01032083.1~~GHRR01032083.1.p2  ORF type:complete len:112 (-),score=24.42 GHRR01032083.1:196-531(-)
MSGSPSMTDFHQCMPWTFVSVSSTTPSAAQHMVTVREAYHAWEFETQAHRGQASTTCSKVSKCHAQGIILHEAEEPPCQVCDDQSVITTIAQQKCNAISAHCWAGAGVGES